MPNEEYDEALAMIAKTKAQGWKREESVDVSGILKARPQIEGYDYKRAVETLNRMISKGAENAVTALGAEQMREPEGREAQITGGIQKGERALRRMVLSAGKELESEIEKEIVAARGLGKRREAALGTKRGVGRAHLDLKRMVGGLESEIGRSVKAVAELKPKGRRGVLEGLSVQDQISELERIGTGLDARRFNLEQLGIIKEEVGLLKKRSGSERPGNLSEVQRGLLALRNQRLAEVMERLGMR